MALRTGECAIRDYSRTFVDKKGESILIKTLSEGVYQGLIDMYLAYQPRDSFDGLPPIKDAACVQWVQSMICNGINLVALSSDGSIVGHAAIFLIDQQRCEMLMVVSPQSQNTRYWDRAYAKQRSPRAGTRFRAGLALCGGTQRPSEARLQEALSLIRTVS
jgi:hypothetical protein